jgi:tRNA-(ms[2]io[6]A)-hydroxylase
MADKRRLPVLQSPRSEEEEAPARPPWQWVGFGVVAIFAAWLPLAALAQKIGFRLATARLGPLEEDIGAFQAALATLPRDERARLWADILVPQGLALALASAAGGYVIGRWGSRAGMREAAIAGALVALGASAAACGSPGIAYVPFVIAAISVPCAALGARSGGARRARQKASDRDL